MGEVPDSASRVSLRAAACMLAGDVRDPIAGERVRRAVAAQLRRAGVEAQDAGDVRTEVVLALLGAPAPELLLPLELVCARASAIARNKAIDHGRRRARAPLALGDELPEAARPGRGPGLPGRRPRRGHRDGAPAAGARRPRARPRTPRPAPARSHRSARRGRGGARGRAPALDLLPRARACPGAAAQRPARSAGRDRCAGRPRAARSRGAPARRGRARRRRRGHRSGRRHRRGRARRA